MTSSDGRARLLLVDDRPENLFALEAILEPLGHESVRASSGEEALRQVLLQDFACILLDVQMPGMNGFETAQLIKSRERSRYTPIIFLTAISKEDAFVYEGYSVGAVDYLFKPFNPDVLRSKVAVFVDLYLKTEQLKEQEQRLRESERRELELRHHAELGEREARLAEIVDSAMEAIMTFGDDRRITLFNAAAERMFGVRRDEALRRGVSELFEGDPPGPERMERICEEARGAAGSGAEAEAQRSIALVGIRADGGRFPVEASISCLELESERVFTVIARDISERKAAEEALRQQAVSLARATAELKSVNEQLKARQSELEAAMSARSRFYASMSHELRTPINAILGYSALLLDNIYGPLTPEQERGIDRANKAAKHLLELVNDILDLSKIEAGKVELEIQPATFPAIIQDLFVTVRPMADEHGSALTLDCEGDPATIITDPRRVRQILLNLLSNAIKFGEGKPIRVMCRTPAEGGVEVEVVDEGMGIAEEDLDKIFDEFVQLSQPNQHQGTGLGLPISRRLAQLLDGSLEVRSRVGEGSCFRLVLPAKVTEARFNAETAEFAMETVRWSGGRSVDDVAASAQSGAIDAEEAAPAHPPRRKRDRSAEPAAEAPAPPAAAQEEGEEASPEESPDTGRPEEGGASEEGEGGPGGDGEGEPAEESWAAGRRA